MTTPASPRPAGQPSLDELMARFLAAKTAAPPEPDAEVEPYEVAGGFRAAAGVTWDEALAAFRLFGVTPDRLPAPPEWAAFAGLDGSPAGVPLAAGVFPQRVRQVPPPFGGEAPAAADPVAGFAGLRGWVRKALGSKSPTALLAAAGVAAALGDRADADAALTAADSLCSGPWRAVWENQRAAVLWLFGDRVGAREVWAAVADGPAALNRGMAALFTGRPAEAVAPLQAAADALPDSSGWRHLAGLYLSLARNRG